MSSAFRLGILQVPSPFESAWRAALGEAANLRGVALAKDPAGQAAFPPDQSVVVLVRNTTDIAAVDATHWAILNADLRTAAAAGLQKSPGHPRKAYKLVAERLAPISWLRDRGAVVFDASAMALDFPGLGPVTRADVGPIAPTDTPLGPLELYAENPPRIGAKTSLPMEVFTFKKPTKPLVEPPFIDLTGRGRVVVFGPRHDLPAGTWRVTCRFNVDTEASDVYLKFQWGVGEDFETTEIMVQQSGGYQLVLDHTWSTPGTAELRVWAANAHFVGQLEFLGADIERMPDAPDPALDRMVSTPA